MTHQTGTDKLYPDRLRYVGFDESWAHLNTEHARQAESDQQRRGANADFMDHQDPRAIAWAEDHGADLLIVGADGNPLTDILRLLIRQTVATALKDHSTNVQLANALCARYAFDKRQASLIAHTEVALSLCCASFCGALAVGMKVKRWLLSNDPGVCGGCRSNAEQGWIAIDAPYASGALAPLDHAGCRCDAGYRRAIP